MSKFFDAVLSNVNKAIMFGGTFILSGPYAFMVSGDIKGLPTPDAVGKLLGMKNKAQPAP